MPSFTLSISRRLFAIVLVIEKVGLNSAIKIPYLCHNLATKSICNNCKNCDSSKYKNGMQHLTIEQRNEVRNKLYNIITSYKSVKIISTVTDIERAYKLPYINNQNDLYWYSYKQAVERFQYYLQDLSRESGAEFNGLVIIDNRLSCDDNRLRNLHHKIMIANHEGQMSFNNLVEGLFIAPSHLSVGVQFADLIAGAIYRKFEKDDDKFYNQIKKSIRNKNGNITGYGIVEFPRQT